MARCWPCCSAGFSASERTCSSRWHSGWSYVRCFEFMAAVPALLVPDNFKSAINRACRYEPEANSTYEDLAGHYGTVILAARPFRPRDKAGGRGKRAPGAEMDSGAATPLPHAFGEKAVMKLMYAALMRARQGGAT